MKRFWAILLSVQCLLVFGQTDSIIQLSNVDIYSHSFYNLRDVGIQEKALDTLVLQHQAYQTFSELLSEHAPLYIKNYGRGSLSTASFRGTAPSHTSVLWNGLPVNSAMLGMVDLSLLPVAVTDRVNILHGSASATETGGALGGAIMLDNTPDWNPGWQANLLLSAGSYSTFSQNVALSYSNEKWETSTKVFHTYSANDFTFTNRLIGHFDEATGTIIHPLDTNKNASFKRLGAIQEIHFRPRENQLISLNYWIQQSERSIPRPVSYEGAATANLSRQHSIDNRLVMKWQSFIGNHHFRLNTGLSNSNMDFRVQNLIPGRGYYSTVFSTSREHNFLNTLSWEWNSLDAWILESSLQGNVYNVSSLDSVSTLGYDAQREEIQWHGAIKHQLTDWMQLHVMARQLLVDNQWLPIIPLFGLNIKPFQSDFMVKASVARNYHLPTLNDLYWQPGGNQQLRSEESKQVDIGWQWLVEKNDFKLNIENTWFNSNISNWIIWLPGLQGYWSPRNIKSVRSRGTELAVTGSYSIGPFQLHVTGNYTYNQAIHKGDPAIWGEEVAGKQLVLIPKHNGNLYARADYADWWLTWQHQSMSERFTTTTQAPGVRNWLYPFYMNNLSIGKSLKIKEMKLKLEGRILNLFNETYHTLLYRPMPGRNYELVLIVDLP